MSNLCNNPQELFEALEWKLENGDCGQKKKIIQSLVEWYSDKGFYSPKQIDLVNSLLGE